MTIKISANIVATQCVTCGVIFGIEEGYLSVLKRLGRDFHCTNGHQMTYVADNPEADKLARVVERQEAQIESLKAALDSKEALPMKIGSVLSQPTFNMPVLNERDPYAE